MPIENGEDPAPVTAQDRCPTVAQIANICTGVEQIQEVHSHEHSSGFVCVYTTGPVLTKMEMFGPEGFSQIESMEKNH